MATFRWRRAIAAALLLTACSPAAARAAFPGTNGPIAFEVNSPGGGADVWTATPDGTDATQLTSDDQNDRDAAFAPDGRSIAFASDRDGNFEIYVMDADGKGQRRLTNSPGADVDPAWSPDGKRITFMSTRDGNREIYAMNADGTGVTRLTNDPAIDQQPAWSPDGAKIAFETGRDGDSEIYSMNADGSGQTRLTTSPGIDRDAAWSPDGKLLAFTSDRSGTSTVYTMGADGSSQKQLETDPAQFPAWAPDGSEIAVTKGSAGSYFVDLLDAASGKEITNFVVGASQSLDPDWGQLPAPVTPPAPAQTANAAPTSGDVQVTLPDTFTPVDLVEASQVPVGSTIDATSGSLRLQVADPSTGKRQQPLLSGGLFTFTQSRRAGTTTFVLRGRTIGQARTDARRNPVRRVRLHGHCRGCSIGGRHGGGAGQGTTYSVEDRCEGTLIRDIEGTVVATDFDKPRRIVLRSGQRYLARAPAAERARCRGK